MPCTCGVNCIINFNKRHGHGNGLQTKHHWLGLAEKPIWSFMLHDYEIIGSKQLEYCDSSTGFAWVVVEVPCENCCSESKNTCEKHTTQVNQQIAIYLFQTKTIMWFLWVRCDAEGNFDDFFMFWRSFSEF